MPSSAINECYAAATEAEYRGNLRSAKEQYLGGITLLGEHQGGDEDAIRARFETETGRVTALQAFEAPGPSLRSELLAEAIMRLTHAAELFFDCVESTVEPFARVVGNRLAAGDQKTSLGEQAIRTYTLLADLHVLLLYNDGHFGTHDAATDAYEIADDWYENAFNIADTGRRHAKLALSAAVNGARAAHLLGKDANYQRWSARVDEASLDARHSVKDDELARLATILSSHDAPLGSLLDDFYYFDGISFD